MEPPLGGFGATALLLFIIFFLTGGTVFLLDSAAVFFSSGKEVLVPKISAKLIWNISLSSSSVNTCGVLLTLLEEELFAVMIERILLPSPVMDKSLMSG